MEIIFVAKKLWKRWPDIGLLDEAAVSRQSERFRGGVNNWIVQSYLRLREPLEAAGIRVSISDRFRADAICIAHRDDLNFYSDFPERAYLIGIRADRAPLLVGNRQIVQNPLKGRRETERYLPFWPQPGLVSRDPSRGTRIERMAYFGRDSSAPVWFRDNSFHRSLHALGLSFEIRTSRWHDYSDVDLVLAHRDEALTMLREKPANKLTNAWLAGAPALISAEPAYMELRRNELDFRIVDTPQSVLLQVKALLADRGRYASMIENGKLRSREFTVESVRGRWLDFILGDIIMDYRRWQRWVPPLILRLPEFVTRLSRQKLAAKCFRAAVRKELREKKIFVVAIRKDIRPSGEATTERVDRHAEKKLEPPAWIRQAHGTNETRREAGSRNAILLSGDASHRLPDDKECDPRGVIPIDSRAAG